MKKKIASTLLLSMCFFGGFEISFAAGCPTPQDGYECYCPEDGTECYNIAPLKDIPATPPVGTSAPGGPSVSAMQNLLQVGGGDISANGDTNVTFKDNFLRNIQVYIMGLLGIVSVSVFLYIGYMLFTAQGKEEDFKNAWKALTYAVVGLAVIPLAFIAVRIVTGFTF